MQKGLGSSNASSKRTLIMLHCQPVAGVAEGFSVQFQSPRAILAFMPQGSPHSAASFSAT